MYVRFTPKKSLEHVTVHFNKFYINLLYSLQTAADEESKLELEGEQENKTMTFVDSTVSLYSDWPLVGGKYYYDRKDKIETFNL